MTDAAGAGLYAGSVTERGHRHCLTREFVSTGLCGGGGKQVGERADIAVDGRTAEQLLGGERVEVAVLGHLINDSAAARKSVTPPARSTSAWAYAWRGL